MSRNSYFCGNVKAVKVLGLVVLFWFGSVVLQALGGWSRWVPAFRSDAGASTADP